jgi:hypothetical protein
MLSQSIIYQIMNNKCEAALIDFYFHEDGITWITENKSLFNAIHGNQLYTSNGASKQFVYLLPFYNLYINALVVFAAKYGE